MAYDCASCCGDASMKADSAFLAQRWQMRRSAGCVITAASWLARSDTLTYVRERSERTIDTAPVGTTEPSASEAAS